MMQYESEHSESNSGAQVFEVTREDLIESALFLKSQHQYLFLQAIHHFKCESHEAIFYWFHTKDELRPVALKLLLASRTEQSEKVPSLGHIFTNAQELERSSGFDLFDVELMQVRSTTSVRVRPHEEILDEVSRFDGGSCSSAHNLGIEQSFHVRSLNNKIQKLELRFDLQDTPENDFEFSQSNLRSQSLSQVAQGLLHYDGIWGGNWSLLFFKSIEDKLGLVPPDKALAVRMALLEVSRIQGYLEWLHIVARQIENSRLLHETEHWSNRLRSLLSEDKAGGADSLFAVLSLGGIHRSFSSHWIRSSIKLVASIERYFAQLESSLLKMQYWKQFRDFSCLSLSSLVAHSVYGHPLRASGALTDLRKSSPYYLYNEVEFDVPLGIDGSFFDRIFIAVAECRQSCNIIFQLLDNLPFGETSSLGEGAPVALVDGYYFSMIESSMGMMNLSLNVKEGQILELRMGANDRQRVSYLKEHAAGLEVEDIGFHMFSMPWSVSRLCRTLC